MDIVTAILGSLFSSGGNGGSSSDYGTSVDLSLDTLTYILTIYLKNKDGDTLSSDSIDLPIESTVVNGSYDSQTKSLILTLTSGQTITIPIADLIAGLQAEITAQNKLSADLVDDTNTTHKFVTAALYSKLVDLVPTWKGTKAEYTQQQSSIPNGTLIFITDDDIVDSVPTQYSTNLVESGGVYSAIADVWNTIGDINTVLEGVL